MNSVTTNSRMRTLVNTVVGLVILAFVSVLPAFAQEAGFNPVTATVTEGNSVTLTVELYDAGITNAGTANYVVQTVACTAPANSATAGDDFVVSAGTITFPAGSAAGATQTISVATVEDSIRENPSQAKASSECFEVEITGVGGDLMGTKINRNDVEVTIIDDEDNPTIALADGSGNENAGVIPMVVTLSNAIDEDLAFYNDGATGYNLDFVDVSATEDTDYNGDGATDYLLGTISAGDLSASLNVVINDDNKYEGDETANVSLPADARYTISDGVGILTIVDNEGVPKVAINDATAIEGNNLTFTLTADIEAEDNYDVALSYTDLTATTSLDYTPDVLVTIANTGKTGTATVGTTGDTDVEGNENFIVTVVDGADYDPDSGNENGLGTITDNDGTELQVTVAVADESIDLDGTPATTVVITVKNNGVQTPAGDVTLSYPAGGFLTGAATLTGGGYSGSTTPADDCGTNATIQDGSKCDILASDLEANESVTLELAVTASGSAGDVVVLTASVADSDDTDNSNDSDSDSATLVGLDYGDRSGAAYGGTAPTHRISSDLKLGATVAAEASNDGLDTATDDDGVSLPVGNLVKPAAGTLTNYIAVDVQGGSGYLSIIPEIGDITAVNDYAVSEGLNFVPLDIASTAGGSSTLRFRLCAAIDDCDDGTEAAQTGEVEDWDFSIVLESAVTGFTLPAGTVEPVVLSEDAGGDLVLTDGNGNTMLDQDYTSVGSTTDFTITGNDNPNTLVVDLADIDDDFGLVFNGGAGADAIEINDTDNGSWAFTHAATNASDGAIDLESTAAVTIDIDYTLLAPVLATVTITTATFTFSDVINDNIVIRDNGSSVDGMSFIDSNGSEAITFTTPTTALVVNAGGGNDTIDYDGLDETNTPSPTLTFNGNAGQDTFVILPTANTSSLGAMTVAGGTPAVCPGDVLDIDTSGGAVINNLTTTPVTFTSAHNSITYSGIEAFADQSADVAISATSTAGTDLNAGDITTITLSVTNNGTDTASCVMVNDILLDGAFTLNSGPTFSVGSFTSPKWTVGALASGDTATLTYTVTVGQTFNGAASITVNSPESDPNESNNSVSFNIEPAFEFPTKAQATAAAWFGTGANEHLVVGLANGFAGLNSSVLCRVPPATGFPANLWRECGNGLPYPLYVNDLFLDDQGTPADSTDDKLYLASWGSAGLYVSEDGGENFTALEPDLGDHGATGWTNVYAIVEDVDGFLYISTNHGFVYRSLNNGSTWQKIGDLPEVDADTPWSLATHPTENGRLYAGTFGRGVYTSDDYGFTWSFLGGSAVNQLLINNQGGHIFDLELTPSSNATSGFLFAATGGGVFRMALDGDGNAAGLWSQLDTDVTLTSGTVTPEARALAFDRDEDLYVTTWGHGAFFSSGPTTATSMTQIVLRGANVSFVAVNPAGDQVIFGTEAQGVLIMPVASSTDTEPIAGEETTLPSGYVLNQNYPNPFNPVTTISFALPESGQVRLSVYDVLGREVKVLVNGTAQAGQHEVQFDAAGLPTGTYIYRLETDKGSFAKQLVLMK
ncbi:MAG: T9SS type A sorting domain-containing protein [Rhodothermales bacterium]|nr:T9SS type A sorting domain-containing protein [Rhodothermales bacterium]MBO6779705.1 T9SS type A sorting domain-containing protein [Rhodothermales bacterium]